MKRRLVRLIPLALFAGLAVFLYRGLGHHPDDRESALIGREFPGFSLATVADPDVRHDASLLAGEVTLVNVWGAWCPTCREEMPQLLTLAERGVRLVGVDYKDTREAATDFLTTFGDPFAVNLFDPAGSLGFDLGVYGAPESFLVDREGIIRYHHTGYIRPEDVEQEILPRVQRWRND
ncbi:MAG: cytochrome c bioproteinis protein CcmG, thiol:disulfide interchange protein DsbE [Halomonadaceae bacterium T82-2]|nr:MAG: cytochrome c bioproteinis protein CcmG, thiol:disulfide interchange protein DsbE [Halomonadaceae bacterium T82-2]